MPECACALRSKSRSSCNVGRRTGCGRIDESQVEGLKTPEKLQDAGQVAQTPRNQVVASSQKHVTSQACSSELEATSQLGVCATSLVSRTWALETQVSPN